VIYVGEVAANFSWLSVGIMGKITRTGPREKKGTYLAGLIGGYGTMDK
jgi:hypothetical protein